MKFNSPYGPVDANIEGLKIEVKNAGTGYTNSDFKHVLSEPLLSRQMEIDLRELNEKILNATNELIVEKSRVEELLISNILRDILKREPGEEDFKKVTRLFGPKKIGEREKYILVFNDITLGTVVIENVPDERHRLIFYPGKSISLKNML